MSQISVSATHRAFSLDVTRVRSVAHRVLMLLNTDDVAFDIFLVSQPRMRFLNKAFRKKDMPTNVLSFCEPKEFIDASWKEKYLGEIYICPSYIRSYNQDMKHMVVHGILHLFGFDHETKKERTKMERKERELFTNLQ